MFDVPRCREWTPLATQQLRLRSLIQIVGYNIRPPERVASPHSYYYTLHTTSMSAPFYSSERISSPHPKWRELHADLTQRMSSTNVVIRIWCHHQPVDNNDKPSDIIIQTWGVYFSGLRLIGANLSLDFTSDSFKANTLVFQMHGGYFCSYKSLNLEAIPSENLYELNSVSSGSSSNPTDASQKIPIEANYLQNHRIIKESRSISPTKRPNRSEPEYSKSHSPTERGFRRSFAKIKPSASLNIAQNRNDNQVLDAEHIYEHSPDKPDVKVLTLSDHNCDISKHPSKEDLYRSLIDLSETAENYDLRNEESGIPKCRYMCLNFLKSEIRPSYKLEKLQNLHLLQYVIKKRKDAVQDIKERIYKKSALENLHQTPTLQDSVRLRKSRRHLFSPEVESETDSDKIGSDAGRSPSGPGRVSDDPPLSNGPRPNLKLTDLLSYKSQPTPRQRSEHARLTRQLEVLRFKRGLLADERDGKLAAIRRLKERHARLYEENQDTGTELMQGYHALSRRSERLRHARQSAAALRELAARATTALAARQNALLAHLRDVFVVESPPAQSDEPWRICGLPLPIYGDEPPRRATPSDAAAAALAARCCRAAAALLARPLRYRIELGVVTKIVDDLTPDLPDPEIPLVPRGGDSTLFRYGMFLLNKCCAQLLWGCGRPVTDVRPTLANLQRLMAAGDCLTDARKLFAAHGAEEAPRAHAHSLRSLVASERAERRQFNRFKDCVDAHSPGSIKGLWRHRHSRSVGSYCDQEIGHLDISTTSIMGSEPFLHETKMTGSDDQLSKRSSLLKTHNSDSELSRISPERARRAESKVVFTLGEDTKLEGIKPEEPKPVIVKLSTNDEECLECMDDNVKKICSEISDFWPKAEGKDFAMGGNVEDPPCEACTNDGLCGGTMCLKGILKDVIEIQTAGALADTHDEIEGLESTDRGSREVKTGVDTLPDYREATGEVVGQDQTDTVKSDNSEESERVVGQDQMELKAGIDT